MDASKTKHYIFHLFKLRNQNKISQKKNTTGKHKKCLHFLTFVNIWHNSRITALSVFGNPTSARVGQALATSSQASCINNDDSYSFLHESYSFHHKDSDESLEIGEVWIIAVWRLIKSSKVISFGRAFDELESHLYQGGSPRSLSRLNLLRKCMVIYSM